MSYSEITSSETDANSPLNKTLMDKIRENFDYLYGREQIVFARSETFGDDTVVEDTTTLIDSFYIYIPSEYDGGQVDIYFRGKSDNVGSMKLQFKINSEESSAINTYDMIDWGIDAADTWESSDTSFPVTINGTGYVLVEINVRNNDNATSNVSVSDLVLVISNL